jgi:hypothetical protein
VQWWARDLAHDMGVSLTRLRHWVQQHGYLQSRTIGRQGHVVVWTNTGERDRLRRLEERANRLRPYPAPLIVPKCRPNGKQTTRLRRGRRLTSVTGHAGVGD